MLFRCRDLFSGVKGRVTREWGYGFYGNVSFSLCEMWHCRLVRGMTDGRWRAASWRVGGSRADGGVTFRCKGLPIGVGGGLRGGGVRCGGRDVWFEGCWVYRQARASS